MLSIPSPAKLNLFLEVTDKRPDGYHNIDSIFLEIDLADTVRARETDDGLLTLRCNRTDIPTDGTNLILKAAEMLRRECGIRRGLEFSLEKRIPAGAGLGGGSSNAAAALRLANAIWGCGLSTTDLTALGARVGSDVPFFLHGGTCLCRGRGEKITKLPAFPDGLVLGLVLPGIFSATAAAYHGLRLPTPDAVRTSEPFVKALEAGDARAMSDAAFNRFEESVFAAFPALAHAHAELERELGIPVRMSGSGSGLWFFAPHRGALAEIPGRLTRRLNMILLSGQAFRRAQPPPDEPTFCLTSPPRDR